MEKIKAILTKALFICFIVFTIAMLLMQIARAESVNAAPVGTVTFVTGNVNITHADKTVVPATKNAALSAGDAIETKNGRLQLSFIDGGKVSLQPNTIYKINKYAFSSKEDGNEFAFTELIKGGLRTISGLIGHKNRERYQLKTAVATIGIRGTEFTVNFNDNQLLMTTNQGSVDVCNAGGCLNATTGQSIIVSSAGAAPKPSNTSARAAAAPNSSKPVFIAADILKTPNALANYNGPGFISTVMKTAQLNGFDGVYEVNLNTGSAAQPNYIQEISLGKEILPTNFSSINSDGLIGWGRAYGGTATASGTTANIEWMDYAIGTKPVQVTNLTGTYHVFGSTAPMLLIGGISTTVGAENAVTGDFSYNFSGYGNYTYNLNVNTIGANYALNGSGSILSAANPTFQTGGTVTSAACLTGACSSALQGGNTLIQGAFFGPSGERIGLQYGFNAPVGQIFGTAVLK